MEAPTGQSDHISLRTFQSQCPHQYNQPVRRHLLVLPERGEDGQDQTSQDDQKPAGTQNQNSRSAALTQETSYGQKRELQRRGQEDPFQNKSTELRVLPVISRGTSVFSKD